MNAMLRSALRKFRGLLRQLEVNMLGDEGEVWETELKKFLRKEPCWVKTGKVAKTTVNKLLEFVTTMEVTAVKKFVAADVFKAGESIDGVAYCTSFGVEFTEHFLPKIEENVPAATLWVHKLLHNSKDLGICTEIGGDKEETKLADLHQCLKRQGKGEKGVLLTNGRSNIFYIRGVDGNIWAVYTVWCGNSWRLSAEAVVGTADWFAGNQVFSR